MNKKAKTMLLSLGLVGVVGAGATLAYFSDSGSVTNTFTFGKGYGPNGAGFELFEHQYSDDLGKLTEDITTTGTSYNDVKPGQELPKDPTIKLDASVESYLFIAMDSSEMENIAVKEDDADWTNWKNVEEMSDVFEDVAVPEELNVYCYTNNTDSLAKADKIAEIGIFDNVVVNKEFGSETKPTTTTPLKLTVKGAAVQADATPSEALGLAIGAFTSAE